jgi:hypothetical protein
MRFMYESWYRYSVGNACQNVQTSTSWDIISRPERNAHDEDAAVAKPTRAFVVSKTE